ncbi:MAG: HAMP domain-containing protein [Deltaproteobacteria bacterium]|nr:HAMP domain-containing protein [Deltaproteobacteria bacterium]
MEVILFVFVDCPDPLSCRRTISHLPPQRAERLLQQIENRLSKEALLIKAIIEKDYKNRAPSYEIDSLIKRMGKDINERITFIDAHGTVLGDTEIAPDNLQNIEDHSGRPEFIAAFKASHGVAIRYSTTLKIDMMYVAAKIAPQGEFLGVVRVAVPLTQIKDLMQKTEYSLLTAFVLCAVLILVLNIIVSRRLSKPVEEITRAAEEISKGNFDVKVYPGVRGELGILGRSVNRMASEIRKRVSEITQEKETLQTILRGMSDGVMVVNSQGEITLINRVLHDLFPGMPTAIGKTPVEVIRNAELQDGFAKVLEEGETFKVELSVATPEADKIFDVTIVRLMPQDKTEGAVAVFHDITDLKRIEKVRRDFVANVSHELRTPLTSIKGYAETLCDEDIEDVSKARSFAQIILKHANQLSGLVQDLLSLTRLESQSTVLIKKEINVREVLDASILVVKPSAEKKRLTIQVESAPEKIMVRADKNQIGQALVNLLDNAVKYTPEGGSITVVVEDAGKEVHVTVKDTGIGIPRKDLNRIFERFYRVDKNRSREMGGTGLGLSIVKHIILGHGGRVWVRSELEKGSAFSFSLPKEQSHNT